MRILKKTWFLIFIITLSCTIKKTDSQTLITKVVLYKQATTSTDADVSFDKKAFWDTNVQEHTFIYQIFADNEYQNIINKVKKMEIVAYTSPQHFTGINYAFVTEKANKKHNDTVYYDGEKGWWLNENGKEILFEDKDEKLAEELRRSYRIFSKCGY